MLTSIPSPDVNSITLNIFGWQPTIHFYALFIIAGIVVAAVMTNYRLTRRGGEPWITIDISIFAVLFGIVGARFYHVVTHAGDYFYEGHQWWNPFVYNAIWNIWDGGIAIYGALIGGAMGAWLGCKWTKIRFWSFADALAPGLLLAQAIGRFGNWFNEELFGLPTDAWWGLQISSTNPAFPIGLEPGTLFQPTFLFESLWNVVGVFVLLWAGRKFTLQWGRLFGLYLVWYSAGRIVWESIRIDPSFVILGLRTNVWAAVFGVLLGLAIIIIQGRRHPGLEPSVYQPGYSWPPKSDIESQNVEFVDISDPSEATSADDATSVVVTK